jgi:hypothetical protein
MPFCPGCREEYRPGFTTCPDCGVALVGELAAADPPQEEAWAPLRVEGEELFAEFTAFCTEAGIPWRQREEILLLPAEVANRLLGHFLEGREGVVLDPPGAAGDLARLRPFDPELDGEIRECELLERPDAELAGDEEALDRLVEVAIKGELNLSLAAVDRLARLGEGGRERLVALLGPCCLAGEDLLLRTIVKVLARLPHQGAAESLAPLLEAEDPRAVVHALHGIWRLELRELAGPVSALLLHPDEEVQREADEVLVEFTGRDLGFDPGLDRAEKIRIMEQRQADIQGA